jgi:integrase
MFLSGNTEIDRRAGGKSRGNRLSSVENTRKFSKRVFMAIGFSTKSELFSIVCPADKPSIDVWHSTELGFGARIMRENKRSGQTRRSYICRYKNEQGKDQKEVLGLFNFIDYSDAQDQVRAKRTGRMSKEKIKLVPTLREALARYLSDKADSLSDATVKDYHSKWNLLDGDAMTRASGKTLFSDSSRLSELNSEWWLAKYKAVRLRNGPASAIGLYRTARAVYEHFIALEYVGSNPLLLIKATVKIRKQTPSKVIIPANELPKLWAWLNLQAQPATRDFLLVAMLAGLRASVIGGLRWDQVSIERRAYIVAAEERGNKAKLQVEVPIPDALWDRVFAPRLAARRNGQNWVISSGKLAGKPATSVRSALEGLKADTGIECSPQILRRTFASLAQMATSDALLVSRMLTHSNRSSSVNVPAVTAGYISYESADLRIAFNKTAAFILERCKA